MADNRFAKAQSIFEEIVELPHHLRPDRLVERCGDDKVMQAEVQDLLQLHDVGSTFLQTPALESLGAAAAVAPLPNQLGDFTIIRLIGEGGMGSVYQAEQKRPKRAVALKVIRPGMASPSTLRRFEHEATALAQLKHPGIAQIFNAGSFSSVALDGRTIEQPYFAMELVGGRPLDEAAASLSLRDRVELLAKVTDAVQHAHQRGVIHRDLKPANILVEDGPVGSVPQPKVLDFGVARLTATKTSEGEQTAATAATLAGQLVGTVAYMSPEQIAGNTGEVDTRSDVYSLGVIMYQLIAGRLPYDTTNRSVYQLTQLITNSDPPPLASVMRDIPADLDTIARKAMAREPGHRYESAGALGADLRRFLANEPILARRPTLGYLMAKYARRNRVLVGAAAVIVVLLVSGAISLSVLYVRAQRDRDAAVRSEALAVAGRNAAEKATADAKRQARRLSAVNDFFNNGVLTAANPAQMGYSVKVVDALADAEARAEARLKDEPDLLVTVLNRLSQVNWLIGKKQLARTIIDRANEIWAKNNLPVDYERVFMLRQIGQLLSAENKLDEAEVVMTDLLEGIKPGGKYDGLVGNAERLGIQSDLCELLQVNNQQAKAEPMLKDAIAFAQELEDRGEIIEGYPGLNLILSLGAIMATDGRNQQAADLLGPAIEKAKQRLGPEHAGTLAALNNYCNVLIKLRQFDQAAGIAMQVVDGTRKAYAPDHTMIGIALITAASAHSRTGDKQRAYELITEAETLFRKTKDDGDYYLDRTVDLRAEYCRRLGRNEDAVPIFESLLFGTFFSARKAELPLLIERFNKLTIMYRAIKLDENEIYRRFNALSSRAIEKAPAGSRSRARVLANIARLKGEAFDPSIGVDLLDKARQALPDSGEPQEDQMLIDAVADLLSKLK